MTKTSKTLQEMISKLEEIKKTSKKEEISKKENTSKEKEICPLTGFSKTDSGRFGKRFEINAKQYLNGKRGNSSKVSAKGKTDVTYHGYKLEIKSNCGELEKIAKNDFVVYTMDNERDFQNVENAVVIPADEFFQMMENLGLVREKKSTSGMVKTTIQSYKNSKRKSAALARALEEYPSLVEWKASV